MSSAVSGVFVAALAAAFGFTAFEAQVTGPGPLEKAVSFKVEKGHGARTIARRLRKSGVIASEQLFMAHYMQMRIASYANLRANPILKAGSYEFEKGTSVENVMAALERGRGKLRFITFPEGRTSTSIVKRLAADERLSGEISAIPDEGSLLPSTYDIQPGMERQVVLDRMQDAQRALVQKLWNERAANLPIKTPEEAIILASIVQREMGPNDQPRRIASVFHNRLRRGMRLQSDPTILYGIFLGNVNWSKPILKSEIRKKNAHNTYQIKGLPPTPICNPGRVALEAVLQPAETNDLFFVADGKGGHLFSRTLAEHRAKTREWRKIERAYRERQKREAAEKRAAEAAAKAEAKAANANAELTENTDQSTEPRAASSNSGRAGITVLPITARQPTTAAATTSGSVVASRSVSTVSVAPSTDTSDAGTIPLPVRKPRRSR